MEHKEPTLILHFDVNKTILMSDPAAKRDMKDILKTILTEITWGVSDGKTWEAKSDKPSAENPNPKEWISYDDHIRGLYGRFQENKDIKTREIRKFLEEGQPGARYKGFFEELLRAISVPQEHQGVLGQYYDIIPALFNLIQHLSAEGRSFHVIFRTFGHDIEFITRAWNRFCEGKHPLYPTAIYNGTNGSRDLRLKVPDSYGCFFRDGGESNNTHAKFATLQFPSDKNSPSIVTTFKKIHTEIMKRLLQHQTLALRDYYHWWAKNNEHYTSGKIFLVDKKNPHFHHVFFDDNINIHNFNRFSNLIVDSRDAETELPLPPTDLLNLHLVKAEPFEAIHNPNYFIEKVNLCVQNFAKLWNNA